MSDTRTPHTPIARVLALSVALVAVVGVIVLAFSWPSITSEPRDLPVAIAGPAEAVDQIAAGLDEAQPGAIAFTEVADRDEAVEAIETREVYGAIILGQQPEVLTSSAASAAVAQLLGGAAAQLQHLHRPDHGEHLEPLGQCGRHHQHLLGRQPAVDGCGGRRLLGDGTGLRLSGQRP